MRETEFLVPCRENQHIRDTRAPSFVDLPRACHWWYDDHMLKIRMKREAEQNAGAMKRLTQIEMSIIELGDEDLLDLADIFRGKPETAIAQYAFTEMARRKTCL
jgi:hypothetical protein